MKRGRYPGIFVLMPKAPSFTKTYVSCKTEANKQKQRSTSRQAKPMPRGAKEATRSETIAMTTLSEFAGHLVPQSLSVRNDGVRHAAKPARPEVDVCVAHAISERVNLLPFLLEALSY